AETLGLQCLERRLLIGELRNCVGSIVAFESAKMLREINETGLAKARVFMTAISQLTKFKVIAKELFCQTMYLQWCEAICVNEVFKRLEHNCLIGSVKRMLIEARKDGGQTGRGGGMKLERKTGRVGGPTLCSRWRIRITTVFGNGANGGVDEVIHEDDRNVNMGNGRNGCSYKDFVACKPKEFDGKRGVLELLTDDAVRNGSLKRIGERRGDGEESSKEGNVKDDDNTPSALTEDSLRSLTCDDSTEEVYMPHTNRSVELGASSGYLLSHQESWKIYYLVTEKFTCETCDHSMSLKEEVCERSPLFFKLAEWFRVVKAPIDWHLLIVQDNSNVARKYLLRSRISDHVLLKVDSLQITRIVVRLVISKGIGKQCRGYVWSVHDTFHVSNLKKCLADPTLHVPLEEIQVDARLNFMEEPVEILERVTRRVHVHHNGIL
ncbi:hypothetical protein Tco_1032914, partial [Tanacetum coccineum]